MVLENRVRLSDSQVIKKEDLYIRWEHATKQEIAELCEEGKLHSYQHHKGPINGVLFCVPAYAWHDDRWYHDEDVTYFLLEDVERCEKEYPDFVGNVLPDPALLPMGEDIPIKQIQKTLGMSPQVFVDFLNDDSNDRLLTSWEEGFRNTVEQGGWRGAKRVPYFKVADLDSESLTVHHVDWETFQQSNTAQPDTANANIWSYVTRRDELQSEQKDAQLAELESQLAELQAQLAEAQKKIEDVEGVRRWNKQFLTERADLQSALEKRCARIVELEKELATATAERESGKSLADVVCRMRREGKSDEAIAGHLYDDGKWCTQAQVGALLHADESRVASESMQQRARRLLGKA